MKGIYLDSVSEAGEVVYTSGKNLISAGEEKMPSFEEEGDKEFSQRKHKAMAQGDKVALSNMMPITEKMIGTSMGEMILMHMLKTTGDEALEKKARAFIENGYPGEYEGFNGTIQLAIDMGLVKKVGDGVE